MDTQNKQRHYKHINQAERDLIERLLKNNTPKKQIARLLNRSITTIRKEIKRGSVAQINTKTTKKLKKQDEFYSTKMIYFSDVGQRIYEQNRKNCGRKCKLSECIDLIEFVESNIKKKTMSIDAAIGVAKRHQLFNCYCCTQTVYNYIDQGLCSVKNIDLPKKVRFNLHKHRVRQHKRQYGRSIEERPAVVSERIEFGHWEGDGIVGKNHKGHLLSFVERKTGYGILINVGDKKGSRVVDVIDDFEETFGDLFPKVFKTITFDNGAEFSHSEEMEAHGRTKIYYAHPYSSWERGTNENWNGIVRRYIPKKASFDGLNDDVINRIMNNINELPRKRFGYRTPKELFIDELDNIIQSVA